MRRTQALLILLLALVWVSPAAAQRTTGEIIGKVTDESGAVLPGVTVTLQGAGVPGTPTAVTTETGAYRFPILPPGSYDLEYQLTGFQTLKRAGILVAVGATIELGIKLNVGALTDAITVEGAAPVVNASSAQVSTSYNREWTRNAPVRRMSYFDFTNSAPGVSSNSIVGQSTAAQSLGSSTNENNYQIDGTDISSTPWLSTDAVDEVEVLQLGASAEYGNVQGAVFNIVTRQGSNVFHGDLNYYFQNQGMTGRNTTDAQDGGLPYHRDTWQDVSMQVTGPFMMDKLWFFGSFEFQRDYDSQPGTDPTEPALNDSRRIFWKFNYNITPNHRLMHGYHDDYYWIPDSPNEFTAPSTIGLSHGDNPTPNLVYTGVLSDKTVLEVRYSGFWLKSSTDPNDGSPSVATRFTDEDTGQVTGGIEAWNENRSWRYGFNGKLTRYTERFMGGSHDTNIGLQYGGHGSDTLNGPNDAITFYSQSGQQAFGTTQVPYHLGAKAKWFGAYLDDTYRLGRAVVNLGLRYDHSQGLYPSFPVLDAIGRPTGAMSEANDDVYHWNTLSPRLGVNYRVNQSGRTLVKAHYGRYYKALEASEFRPAVPSVTPGFNFDVDSAGNRVNFVQVSSNSNLRIDPNFKAPYSDQIILQAEQQITTDLGFQANYVYKRGEDYGGWQDIGGTYAQVPYVDSLGAEATGQTLMVYRLTSPATSRIFLQTNPDGMYTRYKGVTMMLTKRMSHNWQAVGSLVLSKAEGRLGSSARATPTTSQSSQAGTFGREAAGPNDFLNTDGRLLGDRPVVAKLQLTYRLPWDVLVAGNIQHQTGKPWARSVRVSGLGFPSAPTIYMEPLTGDRRVADVDTIDLRVQKDFRLPGSPVRLSAFMDALNLTNSDANEGVGAVLGTSSAFGVPTKFIPPRRLQLGGKVQW